jgi:hypothetical protein
MPVSGCLSDPSTCSGISIPKEDPTARTLVSFAAPGGLGGSKLHFDTSVTTSVVPATIPPQWGIPQRIFPEPSFASLFPPLHPRERAVLEESLLARGCPEPLIVWPHEGRQVLITGYEMWAILLLRCIPFRVIEKGFTSRDDAKMFVISHYLSRQILTPRRKSYLRGKYYNEGKQPRGGRRRVSLGRSAAALAERYHVSRLTIHRDGRFAAAVDELTAIAGEWVMELALGPGGTVSQEAIVALAALDPELQQELLMEWKKTGKLPRGRRSQKGKPKTINLPRNPRELIAALRRRLDTEEWAAVHHQLAADPASTCVERASEILGARETPPVCEE